MKESQLKALRLEKVLSTPMSIKSGIYTWKQSLEACLFKGKFRAVVNAFVFDSDRYDKMNQQERRLYLSLLNRKKMSYFLLFWDNTHLECPELVFKYSCLPEMESENHLQHYSLPDYEIVFKQAV